MKGARVRLERSMSLAAVSVLLFLLLSVAAHSADADIRLNSLGFLPNMPKAATIVSPCKEYNVRSALDQSIVYSGTASGPIHQENVKQDAWIADFSKVSQAGTFYLDVPGVGRSIEFKIDPTVYREAYYAAMRGFYLWRCGTAVKGDHNGIQYSHETCHLDDAWQDYIGRPNTRRDGAGGWHDAGDFGKYTVNAGVTLGVLFMAWDQFGERIESIPLDLPNTAPGVPDFLKELKWQTDWLLKMPYPDDSGRVSHKLTRLHFAGFVMPETDNEKRYFTDWGSAATADFAAVMAMAARVFEPYDPNYAKTCLSAAIKSYEFVKDNPEDKKPDLKDFTTGGYGTRDSDDRLWAAAELWRTTGNADCLADFEQRVRSRGRLIEPDFDWGNVTNLGMLAYLLTDRTGRDSQLVDRIRTSLLETADGIVRQSAGDIYARPLSNRYYWGSNGSVARQTVLLMTAYKIEPKKQYLHTSLDAIANLLGRNYYGRSYVTGIGFKPPLHPHDRRSGADNVAQPWPGYLVGGGESATDWKDIQDDYRTNEIAINWQAALVYALAAFTPEPLR